MNQKSNTKSIFQSSQECIEVKKKLTYWKRGLESAMLAHFSSDIVLHFLIPLLFLH